MGPQAEAASKPDPYALERKTTDAVLTAANLYAQYLSACGVDCHSVTVVFGIAALNEQGKGVTGGDILSLDDHGETPLAGSRFRKAVALATKHVVDLSLSDAVHRRALARKQPEKKVADETQPEATSPPAGGESHGDPETSTLHPDGNVGVEGDSGRG